MEKLKNKIWLQLFIIYTRYLIGGAFVFASIVKIQGNRFTHESGASNPIDSAWHFFETMYQSGLYWKFIGVGQLLAGGLLMTQRFSKLGAIVFFPVILNVFVITISYYFAFTPVITGGMLLANLILIFWDWNELKILINQPPIIEQGKRLEKDSIWEITGWCLFIYTIFCKVMLAEFGIVAWMFGCIFIGLVGLFLGISRRGKYQTSIA